MPKTPRKSYDLAEVIRAEIERVSEFVITVGDKSLRVPPPILWPDKALREDVYTDDAVRLIVGKDQAKVYDAYEAAGGTAKLLLRLATEHYGASLPE